MGLANVNLTDTFDQQRVKINQSILYLNQQNLLLNLAFDTTNAAYTVLNAAFTQANTDNVRLTQAYTVLNAAYTMANADYVVTNAAFTQANTDNVRLSAAYVVLNAAFTQANTDNVRLSGAYVVLNSAFTQANTDNVRLTGAFNTLNAAFTQANTDNVRLSAAYVVTNSAYAVTNAAFTQANTDNVRLSGAYVVLNSAFTQANTDNIRLSAAYVVVNSVFTQSNTDNIRLSSAYVHTNSSYDVANASFGRTNAVYTFANGIYDYANGVSINLTSGYAVANAGYNQANTARDKANDAYGLAQTLGGNTANLITDFQNNYNLINASFVVANGAFNKANGAFSVLNTAFGYTNSVYVVANSVYGFANGINVNVSSGYAVTNAAFGVANGAFGFANGVATNAASAFARANAALPNTSGSVFSGDLTISGTLGVGTTAGALQVDILGDVRAKGNIIFGDASTDYIQIYGASLLTANNLRIGNTTNVLFIDQVNTRVGVGTVSPAVALDVVGSANITTGLTVAGMTFAGLTTNAAAAFGSANQAGINANTAGSVANNANTFLQSYVQSYTASNYVKLSSGTQQSISSDVVVTGNLTVVGQTTYTNTNNLLVGDNIITLNADLPNTTIASQDAGIEVNRGSGVNVSLLWNETNVWWSFTNDGTNYRKIASNSDVESVTQNTTAAFAKANGVSAGANGYAVQVGASSNNWANAVFSTISNSSAAFTTANAAYVVANAAFGATNTLSTTVSTKVSSVTGTTGRVTSSGGTTPVIDLATAGAGAATYSTGISAITVDAYGRVTSVTGSANYLPLAGGSMTGLLVGATATGANVSVVSDTGSFSVRGSASVPAAMSFHRAGAYAINVGLDTDNVFKIGGWSDGTNTYRLQLGGPGGTHTFNGTVAATTFSGAGTSLSGTAASLTAGKASTLAQGGGTGTAMTFNWSGQAGQPSWLWGSNDGANHYVYNPSNFSVAYAATAGSATTATSATSFTSTSLNSQFASIGVGMAAQGSSSIYAIGSIVGGYSDERLKTNIKPIENALEKIKSISGVTFNSNELAATFGYTDTSEQVGVLAQEIEKVIPQVVRLAPFDVETVDGVQQSKSGENYKTVQYERIIPLLIQAIKELQAEVEDLKNKS